MEAVEEVAVAAVGCASAADLMLSVGDPEDVQTWVVNSSWGDFIPPPSSECTLCVLVRRHLPDVELPSQCCPLLYAGSGACACRLRVTRPNSFPEDAVAAHNE